MEQTYFIIEKSTGVKFDLLYDGDGIVDIEQRGDLEPNEDSKIILAQINRIANAFEYNHGNIFNFTIGMGLDSEDEILHTFSGCFDFRMDEILNEDWKPYMNEIYVRPKYDKVKESRNRDNLEYGDILIKFVSEEDDYDYEVVDDLPNDVYDTTGKLLLMSYRDGNDLEYYLDFPNKYPMYSGKNLEEFEPLSVDTLFIVDELEDKKLKEGPNGLIIPYGVAKYLQDPGYFYQNEPDVRHIRYEFFNIPLFISYS